MHHKVSEFIRQKVFVPQEDLEKALAYSTVRHYKKGEYILRIGEYCRFIGFINSGLVVNTLNGDNGKDVVCTFFFENEFFTYLESLKDQVLSHKNFIAVDDCEILLLDKADLPRIFALHPGFEALLNLLILEGFQQMLLYEQEKRTRTVEERYLHILKTHPVLLERAPLKYIAGYLGVEAPSLSRLRKRLVQKREINPG